MAKVKPHTLSGFMELLPARQTQMERMLELLRESFSLYGFTPLDTPIIESAEVLLAKGGGETDKQIYRFTKGESDLALRYDLTVPLAKYVAQNYGRLNFPFRRYQIGKVYRGERAQRGRFREFYQADIDIVGDGCLDSRNDAEIPAVIYSTFKNLGLHGFKIRVNNRRLLNGFFEIEGLKQVSGEIMREIDKAEKQGEEATRRGLELITGSDRSAGRVMDFIGISDRGAGALDTLEQYSGRNAVFDEGLAQLRELEGRLSEFDVPRENFEIDLTIARGLDYYTGTVYETTMTGRPEIGSICSGGRYDDLAAWYSDKKLPGVGISIGLTRLFYVLEEQGYLNEEQNTAPADAIVIPMAQDYSAAVLAATALRQNGVRTQLYCEDKKFKAKLSYADKQSIPFAVIIGEDEAARGLVSVKDLETGEQCLETAKQAAERIKVKLREKAMERPIKEPV